MRRDFVSAFDDLLDQSGMALGDPSENEKGGPGLMTGEKIQQLASVGGDSAFKGAPMSTTNRGIKSRYLEMLFNVER